MWFRNIMSKISDFFTNLYNAWVRYNNPPVPHSPTDTKIGSLILEKNNQIPQVPDPIITLPGWNLKGVRLHRITEDTANELATIIEQAAAQSKLPVTYLLACIAIESAFDPQASNGNFLGSNKDLIDGGWGPDALPVPAGQKGHDPLGYDMGACQHKIRYLIGTNSLTTVDEAKAVAFDPETAIPYMAEEMRTKLFWADTRIPKIQVILTTMDKLNQPATDEQKAQYTKIIQDACVSLGIQVDGSNGFPEINPKATNRYWLATAAYNYGNAGTILHLQNNDFPSHPDKVADLEVTFAKELNQPAVMAGIQGK